MILWHSHYHTLSLGIIFYGDYMETKKCGRCKRELPIDMFYKNKSEKDGLSWHCKDCSKEIAFARKDKIKKYNEEHRKEKSIYNKRYNDKHR